MKCFIILFCVVISSDGREQGPPPVESGMFNEFENYYDIYINETTIVLPNLDPNYNIAQAVYITGNVKISMRELTVFFAKYDFFRYGIRVNNTNLQTLSFFKPYFVNPLDDTTNSIEITNNPNLTTVRIDFGACTYCHNNLLIKNNPMLNLKESCDGIIKTYAGSRVISGNLVDCGCEIQGDFNNYVSTMAPNCWMLFGNVVINQKSDYNVLKEKMANVTIVNGGLSVTDTLFTNLSFLSSIELVFMDPYKTKDLESIIIKNNAELTSLRLNMKRDGLYLTIRDNPKLCVTSQELDNFFYGLSIDSEMDINVCFNNQTPSHWCQLPETGSFKDLPEGCLNLTGDLVLTENFDFENSYKLYDLEYLYGSLAIVNSSLRKTSMFPNLQRIRSIKDDTIPIYVSNNTRLTDLLSTSTWRGMESGQPATILDNPNLIMYGITCDQLRTRKTPVVDKNMENCIETNTKKVVKYDPTPLNVDVYKGIPTFPDVSHGPGNPDGPTWNNPGQNDTDPDFPEDELEVTTGGTADLVLFTSLVLSIALNL